MSVSRLLVCKKSFIHVEIFIRTFVVSEIGMVNLLTQTDVNTKYYSLQKICSTRPESLIYCFMLYMKKNVTIEIENVKEYKTDANVKIPAL